MQHRYLNGQPAAGARIMDFYRFSGIYRDVYLYTVPEVHVYDLQIRAIPDETLSAAALEIRTNTWGKGTVKITLSKDGETVIEDKKSTRRRGNLFLESRRSGTLECRRSAAL